MGEQSNRRWTAKEDQELLDLAATESDWTVIAKTFERGYHAVRARERKLRRERRLAAKGK